MTWILALDTAGSEGSISLAPLGASDQAREFPLDVRQRHAQVLLPAIRSALAECRLTPREISLITVTSGPGSFTGLRVGIMAAKTWAWATGARLVAIPSLTAIAETWRRNHGPAEHGGRLWCVENAQRGELFVSSLDADDEPFPGRDNPTEILPPSALLERLQPQDRVIGPGVALWQQDDSDLVDDLAPDLLRRLRDNSRYVARPSGLVLANLARNCFAAGAFADPLTLEPTYLRRSSAEDKWLAKQAGR